MSDEPPRTDRRRLISLLGGSYGALAVVASLAFLGLAVLFALTVPYHDWDAFGYGEWSRRITTRHAFDPAPVGADAAARPVFFVLQGALWWVTGVSFAAGRLLSLCFAAAAVVCTSLLLERGRGRSLAVIALLAVPLFATEAIAGKTDVPAAAAVAAVAAAALRAPFRGQQWLVGLLAVAAVLTKPSSIVPALAGLTVATLLVEAPIPGRRLVHSRSFAICAGTGIGMAYEWIMAVHLHMGLLAFLRSGTTGYYANLADSARGDTLLRLDFLGTDLRLPLAFAVIYAAVRAVSLDHRRAAWLALALGGAYAVAGPFAAGVANGPFATAQEAFTLVGFLAVLAATPFAPPDLEPARTRTTQLLLIALPPTVVWAVFGIYQNRLEAPAWPALAALIATCLVCAIRTVHRYAGVASLAGIPILMVALWASFVSFDGFHGTMWTEYRALGTAGIWDRARTTNIVLPAVSETTDALRSRIGRDGVVIVSDPHFFFWFPNAKLGTPTKCADLDQADGFVLSTSDESQAVIRKAGGSPDPRVWAACTAPKLDELTDGSNGLAAFVVERRPRSG